MKAQSWAAGGPSLFAQLYLALGVQGALLIWIVYSGRPEPERIWLHVLLGAQATLALATRFLRLVVQDWHSSASVSELALFHMIPISLFFMPAFIRGHAVFPEGFALASLPLLFLAVEAPMARRYLAATLLGFWFALYARRDLGLEYVIAFGVSTLWCLACVHFTFVGTPFGLRGWWPAGRIAGAVIVYGIPASLAAFLAWGAWPEPPASEIARGLPPPEAIAARVRAMSAEEVRRFIIQLGIGAMLVFACLALLYYLRRWLSNRARPVMLPHIVGGELSEVEYAARERAQPRPALAGNRGRIVRLWSEWSRRQEIAAGTARLAGETAAELAERLARETGGNSETRGEIVAKFDAAHYGPVEPAEENVAAMEILVAPPRSE